MKTKKIVLIFVATVFVLAGAFARDLTLDEAVSLGLRENLQMQSATLDLKMSKIAYNYSYNTFLPDVQGTMTFAHPNENTSGSLYQMLGMIPELQPIVGQMSTDPATTLSFGISGTFTFNPAMITSIRIAYENWKNGEITYEKASAQMKQNIRKLYYATVLQTEALKIQEATLNAQKDRYLQAQKDFENGIVPQIYLLQSRVTYENSKPSYDKAVTDLASSKRQFAFLLGLDENEELNLTDGIDFKDYYIGKDDALDTVSERYDIRLLEKSEKLLKMQKEALIESTFIPSVVLKASWQPTLTDINSKKENWVDGGSLSGTLVWNLSNLLPVSGSWKNLSDIKDNLKKLELGRETAEQNARIEILNLLDKIEQTKSTLKSSEGTVELAEESYNMTKESYNAGSSDYLDLKDAENQFNQAKLGRLSNLYNYVSALIDFEYATGIEIL